MASDRELLEIDYRTLFKTNAADRMTLENDPDGSSAPRLWFAGAAGENRAGLRFDLADDVATELLSLLMTEPPFVDDVALPRHLDRYVELLSCGAEPPRPSLEIIYVLAAGTTFASSAKIVASEDEDGKRWAATLATRGFSEEWRRLGFRSVDDLWAPWCAVFDGEELASLAFAARLSKAGAELGVATAPSMRGRGHAAAATAAWSRLPSLASRALFYSASRTNLSSRRVVERLGLRRLGASLRLP